MRMKNIGMTKQDWAAWARLCKRFPEIKRQVDHCAALMAVQAEGHINVLIHVQRSLGGWFASVTGYAPFLEGGYQQFVLNQDEKYPHRFDCLTTATESVMLERDRLFKVLEETKASL